jgi:hypothetical protein
MRCVVPTQGSPCIRCQKARRRCVEQGASAYKEPFVEPAPAQYGRHPSLEAVVPHRQGATQGPFDSSPGRITSDPTHLDREGSLIQVATLQQRVREETHASPLLPSVYAIPPSAHQQIEVSPAQGAPAPQQDRCSLGSSHNTKAPLDWESVSGLSNEEAVELIQVWGLFPYLKVWYHLLIAFT